MLVQTNETINQISDCPRFPISPLGRGCASFALSAGFCPPSRPLPHTQSSETEHPATLSSFLKN